MTKHSKEGRKAQIHLLIEPSARGWLREHIPNLSDKIREEYLYPLLPEWLRKQIKGE